MMALYSQTLIKSPVPMRKFFNMPIALEMMMHCMFFTALQRPLTHFRGKTQVLAKVLSQDPKNSCQWVKLLGRILIFT